MRFSRGYSINTIGQIKINKMNKLSRLLLEKSIVGVDINALIEILDATPNPEMAVEIVLGVYEAPEISETPMYDMGKQKDFVRMVSYDKWSDEVNYEYRSKKSRQVYVKKGSETPSWEEAASLVEYQYNSSPVLKLGISKQEFEEDWTSITVYRDIDGTEEIQNGSTRLSNWHSNSNRIQIAKVKTIA